MSASGGISLDLTVFFVVVVAFWNSVSSDVPHLILLRLQRDTCTTLILLMLRGPSPSIILYFQTEEGDAAKKKIKGFGVLVL